jgi:hypothetical protein
MICLRFQILPRFVLDRKLKAINFLHYTYSMLENSVSRDLSLKIQINYMNMEMKMHKTVTCEFVATM